MNPRLPVNAIGSLRAGVRTRAARSANGSRGWHVHGFVVASADGTECFPGQMASHRVLGGSRALHGAVLGPRGDFDRHGERVRFAFHFERCRRASVGGRYLHGSLVNLREFRHLYRGGRFVGCGDSGAPTGAIGGKAESRMRRAWAGSGKSASGDGSIGGRSFGSLRPERQGFVSLRSGIVRSLAAF